MGMKGSSTKNEKQELCSLLIFSSISYFEPEPTSLAILPFHSGTGTIPHVNPQVQNFQPRELNLASGRPSIRVSAEGSWGMYVKGSS